jgi:hypothetical protein
MQRTDRTQRGFFDQEDRQGNLEKLGDSLPGLDSIVDWTAFRLLLKSSSKSIVRATPDGFPPAEAEANYYSQFNRQTAMTVI